MKIAVTLACVSLAANTLLGYLYWQRSHPAAAGALTPPVRADHSVTQPGKSDAVASATLATNKAGAEPGATTTQLPNIGPELTAALKSRAPRALVLALRQSGFPEKIMREIVVWEFYSQVNGGKLATLLKEDIDRPFWKSETLADRRAREKAYTDLDVTKLGVAREIFGGAVPPEPVLTLAHRRLGFLPADKIERVADLDNDYAAMWTEAMRAAGENRAESLVLLDKEKHADLAKILTPEEIELYDLYTSTSATTLRRQMPAFEPTEAEFRAMYDARRGFDEKNPSAAGRITLGGGPVSNGEKALNEQYRSILGDARYAEYLRGQDRGYQAAVEIVRQFNLPAANAVAAYELQRSTQQQIQDLAKTTAADPEALRTGTQAIMAETNAKLTKLLGAPGADAYLKTSGTRITTIQAGRGGAPATIFQPVGR